AARAAAALRGRRAARCTAATRRPVPPGPPPRLQPAAEHVGANRSEGHRRLLLADRRDAAADAPRGSRARDRPQPQHRGARGRGGRATGGLMAPIERLVPRFVAEPPQEDLPYGRWEGRLAEEFLAAAARIDSPPDDLGEPGPVLWYPDRTW